MRRAKANTLVETDKAFTFYAEESEWHDALKKDMNSLGDSAEHAIVIDVASSSRRIQLHFMEKLKLTIEQCSSQSGIRIYQLCGSSMSIAAAVMDNAHDLWNTSKSLSVCDTKYRTMRFRAHFSSLSELEVPYLVVLNIPLKFVLSSSC